MIASTATLPADIWLVEDDQDDQFLFSSAFKQLSSGSTLKVLNDGDEVVPALTLYAPPAVILMDINMPRQDGFETLKKIRQLPEWASLPVIIFSTSNSQNDSQRAYNLGANAFISKPTDFVKLKTLIGKIIADWTTRT